MTLSVQKIRNLPLDCLSDMITESKGTGFRAIQRLADEWISEANRFDRSGEALFITQRNDRIIGVCGLNIDPYTTLLRIGRVRRLYVMIEHRRRGIGRTLVEQVVTEARLNFDCLHVRTDNEVADKFYRSMGFVPHFNSEYCTHKLELKKSV